MDAGRILADEQALGDLTVGGAPRQLVENLTFAAGELETRRAY